MLDSRYRIRLTNEAISEFSGISLVGALGKSYRPKSLDNFGEETICFCQSKKAAQIDELLIKPVSNAALIVHEQVKGEIGAGQLEEFTRNSLVIFSGRYSPKAVFSILLEQQGPADKGQLLLLSEKAATGDFPSCEIAPDCRIAATARIGKGTIVAPGAIIGDNAVIGQDCIIGEGTLIYLDVKMGDDVHVGPGSLVGSPVHANEQVETDRKFVDIPQIGGLLIGNDVRIGSQTVINRGTLSDTNLGHKIRLGDRVNIGHNAQIGDRVWIAAASIVCGSSIVGDDASIGISAVVKNKMKIGEGAMVGAGSVIISDVPAMENTYPIPALGEKALLTLMRMISKAARRR